MNKAYPDLLLKELYVNSSVDQHIQFRSNCWNTDFEDLPMEYLLNIMKTITVYINVAMQCKMNCENPFKVWKKVNRNLNKKIISFYYWCDCYCGTNTRVRWKKQIQGNNSVRIPGWMIFHLSKIIWVNKIEAFSKFICFFRIY